MNSSIVKRHIICERDVGLFSLILQIVANIHWAEKEGRIPFAYLNDRCAYWTPEGFYGKDTVWEYYFKPLVDGHPVESIPKELLELITTNPPSDKTMGYYSGPDSFVTNHFGDHPKIKHKALQIPYMWKDPNYDTRVRASRIFQQYVRPRSYITEKVDAFCKANFDEKFLVGVHIRGTDAISKNERRAYRQGMLSFDNYHQEIETILKLHPDAKIFVATDSESSLESIQAEFGNRVISFDSIRHQDGEAAGQGPTGQLIPAYISKDSNIAAQNGMEALIECLLLTKSDIFLHNGAGLARTVLLIDPDLPHINTHRPNKFKALIKGFSIHGIGTYIKRNLFYTLESPSQKIGRGVWRND